LRQIIGAPSFFPTVWSWIKRWFDPVTVSKIFILSQAEALPTLEKYIPIENIPTLYGGKLDFKWGDLPVIEPDIADAFEWVDDSGSSSAETERKVPMGPLKWRPAESDPTRLELVLVGTENGTPRNKVIAITKPSVNTKVMSGFLDDGQVSHNEPVTLNAEEEEMAKLNASKTQEQVNKAQTDMEKEGIDVEHFEEADEAKA
jgi:CRAL/TRIO domain